MIWLFAPWGLQVLNVFLQFRHEYVYGSLLGKVPQIVKIPEGNFKGVAARPRGQGKCCQYENVAFFIIIAGDFGKLSRFFWLLCKEGYGDHHHIISVVATPVFLALKKRQILLGLRGWFTWWSQNWYLKMVIYIYIYVFTVSPRIVCLAKAARLPNAN